MSSLELKSGRFTFWGAIMGITFSILTIFDSKRLRKAHDSWLSLWPCVFVTSIHEIKPLIHSPCRFYSIDNDHRTLKAFLWKRTRKWWLRERTFQSWMFWKAAKNYPFVNFRQSLQRIFLFSFKRESKKMWNHHLNEMRAVFWWNFSELYVSFLQ